jgi:hypothetical protein
MSDDTIIVYEEGAVSVIVGEDTEPTIIEVSATPTIIEVITEGPQGIPGEKGDKGDSFVWYGVWAY